MSEREREREGERGRGRKRYIVHISGLRLLRTHAYSLTQLSEFRSPFLHLPLKGALDHLQLRYIAIYKYMHSL
jgi:hypothetical protein